MTTNRNTSIAGVPHKDCDSQNFVILMVGNQTIIAEKVRRDISKDPRIKFHFCSDPKKAIKLAKSINPTVILLDLEMPNINDLKILKLFRASSFTHELPIIVISSKEDAEFIAKTFNAGASDYLIKIPEKPELIARVIYHSTCYLNNTKQNSAYQALLESRKKLNEKIHNLMKQTTVDGLTGVGNRRALDTIMKKNWLLSLRSHTDISLIMIDVDHFKKFNDQYGHIAGDDCLKAIAHSLTGELPRKTDFVARYGGEEFVVILPATNISGAIIVAERLRKKISQLKIANKKSPVSKFVSVSMGVSSAVPDKKMGQLSLIESADSALYEAKESGRNKVAISHSYEMAHL